MAELTENVKTIARHAWVAAATFYGDLDRDYPKDIHDENVLAAFEIWWDAANDLVEKKRHDGLRR